MSFRIFMELTFRMLIQHTFSKVTRLNIFKNYRVQTKPGPYGPQVAHGLTCGPPEKKNLRIKNLLVSKERPMMETGSEHLNEGWI